MIMSMSGRYDGNGREKKRQKRCRVSVVVRRRVVRHDLPAGTPVLRGGSRIADDYESLATDSDTHDWEVTYRPSSDLSIHLEAAGARWSSYRVVRYGAMGRNSVW